MLRLSALSIIQSQFCSVLASHDFAPSRVWSCKPNLFAISVKPRSRLASLLASIQKTAQNLRNQLPASQCQAAEHIPLTNILCKLQTNLALPNSTHTDNDKCFLPRTFFS